MHKVSIQLQNTEMCQHYLKLLNVLYDTVSSFHLVICMFTCLHSVATILDTPSYECSLIHQSYNRPCIYTEIIVSIFFSSWFRKVLITYDDFGGCSLWCCWTDLHCLLTSVLIILSTPFTSVRVRLNNRDHSLYDTLCMMQSALLHSLIHPCSSCSYIRNSYFIIQRKYCF